MHREITARCLTAEREQSSIAVSDSRCMQNSTALCICIGGLGVLAVRYCPWDIPSEVPQLKYLCLSTAINRAMFGGAVKTSVAMSLLTRAHRTRRCCLPSAVSFAQLVCLSACPSVCMPVVICDLYISISVLIPDHPSSFFTPHLIHRPSYAVLSTSHKTTVSPRPRSNLTMQLS